MFRVVSKAVVVNSEGEILLLRRSNTDTRRPNEWDLPGGHMDEGESPAQAAARETAEEAGIQVAQDAMRLAFAMTEFIEGFGSITWLFHIVHTHAQNVSLSREHSEFAWVTLEQAIGMIDYERQKRALRHIADNNLLARED